MKQLVVLLLVICAVATAETDLPWALRDNFSFECGSGILHFAVDSAEWGVSTLDETRVLDHVGAQVQLAGEVPFLLSDLEKAESAREACSDFWGEGKTYRVVFKPHDGLVLEYAVDIPSNLPFALLRLQLRNERETPVAIESLAPAVFGPGDFRDMGDTVTSVLRRVRFRNGTPLFSKENSSQVAFLSAPDKHIGLTIAFLPDGVADSGLEIESLNGVWQGAAVSRYSPPKKVMPGESISAAPLWLCYAMQDVQKTDLLHAWARRKRLTNERTVQMPRAWIGAEPNASAAELYDIVRAWGDAKVNAALVPLGWEGTPGSLNGSPPLYPGNMAEVASTLRKMGMTPGLTIDFTAAPASHKKHVILDADGYGWFNPHEPTAAKELGKLLNQAERMGFEFFALARPRIPDETLARLNMTRAEMDRWVYETLRQATDRPLFPSAEGTVDLTLDSWLEVAGALNQLESADVAPGPVRFQPGSNLGADDVWNVVTGLYTGPIELTGQPDREVKRIVASLISTSRTTLRPLDAAERSPKLWTTEPEEGTFCGRSLVALPGAPEWRASYVLGEPGYAWRLNGDTMTVFDDEMVPATTTISFYGIAPVRPHPLLLGAWAPPTLMLDTVQDVKWDDASATLSGRFASGNGKVNQAFVSIPDGWQLTSGDAETAATVGHTSTRFLAMKMAKNKQTSVQLTFRPKVP